MARSSPRRLATGTRSAAASAAPLVRDFGRGAASATVQWDVRTVYDFALSLSTEMGLSEDLLPADRRWLDGARASLREELGTDPDRFLINEIAIGLTGLVVDRPEVNDAAAFIDALEGTKPDELRRFLLGEQLRPGGANRATALLALDGDLAALESIADQVTAFHGPDERERVVALYRDPVGSIAPIQRVLRAWLPRFAEIEGRVAAMLQRDLELRATDRATLGLTDLIERTTNGVRWLSEPGVSRIILAPSYFSRPYNSLFAGEDWRMFCYPIADAALDSGDPLAPPPAVVRLHRALGDDTRLRILRLLRDQDRYLTEIAQVLELSKPTVKHHLALLRAAGLITVTDEGNYTYYSLRRDRLEQAGAELRAFLLA